MYKIKQCVKQLIVFIIMVNSSLVFAEQADADKEPENPYLELTSKQIKDKLKYYEPSLLLPWYQVELLVFKQNFETNGEYWKPELKPDYSGTMPISLIMEGEGSTQGLYGAWAQLPDHQLYLTDMNDRMEYNGYEVLYHKAWRQPTQEQSGVHPVLIQAGKKIGDTYEVEGTVEITVSRYLHIHPNLWFTQSTGVAETPQISAVLNDSRRMRSEEVHYLDHPLFGVIVRVTPWAGNTRKTVELLQEALEQKQPD